MSQNGPYPGQSWPGGSPEEQYSEAADPWVGHDPSWVSSQPHSSPPHSSPQPQSPQQPHSPQPSQIPQPSQPGPQAPQFASAPKQRRGFAMGATVAVLSVLIGGGLASAAWFVLGDDDEAPPTVTIGATTPAAQGPRPQTSEDARFAAKGQCVRNEGNEAEPELRIVACTANTFQILKRIDGRTTGETDAVGKCAKVPNYTKWYYYDTEYDDVDFVLCLREYEPV